MTPPAPKFDEEAIAALLAPCPPLARMPLANRKRIQPAKVRQRSQQTRGARMQKALKPYASPRAPPSNIPLGWSQLKRGASKRPAYATGGVTAAYW